SWLFCCEATVEIQITACRWQCWSLGISLTISFSLSHTSLSHTDTFIHSHTHTHTHTQAHTFALTERTRELGRERGKGNSCHLKKIAVCLEHDYCLKAHAAQPRSHITPCDRWIQSLTLNSVQSSKCDNV